jgi:short-subunit dehydrogenase
VQRELESIGSGVRVAAVLPGAIRSTMADATRNRPAAYGRAEVPAEVRDAARAFLEQYGADPVAMADDVLRAVFADDRFYIFTGAEDLDMHRMRSEDIEAGRLRPLQPTEVPGS